MNSLHKLLFALSAGAPLMLGLSALAPSLASGETATCSTSADKALGHCRFTPASVVADSQPKSFAVLSLIGDAIEVVTYRGQTESRAAPTDRKSIRLPDPVFDKTALLAAEDSLKKISPGASVILLAPSASLYAIQHKILDGARFSVPAELETVLKEKHVSHLLLLTKYRGDASLKLKNATIGSGKLEGIGYYMDPALRTSRTDTGEVGVGFLAAYAYFKISLVDLATSSVAREQTVTSSTTWSAARSKSLSPWDALTDQQKIGILKNMVRREVLRAVPKLLVAQAVAETR